MVVAIDGPAGSGKSTTARLVAERLGFLYLDTGAMYRALTWRAMESGVDPRDEGAIATLARSTKVDIREGDGMRVLIDGRDVTEELRSPEISREVSHVAKVPAARDLLVAVQRQIAAERDVVVEGRDIATVVFPDAPVKVYLDASLEERAQRRLRDLRKAREKVSLEEVKREIAARDAIDSRRAHSPLRIADGAVTIDTTDLQVEDQVEKVLLLVRRASELRET
jgi:cytidylate kinase